MKKENKCSHKEIEWQEYKAKKKEGDGVFSPQRFCLECEESRNLKISTPYEH